MNSDELLASVAIQQIISRYARGVDRYDWDLVKSCYHDDAIDIHGSYRGGVDGFVDWAKEALGRFERTMHFMGNFVVDVRGQSARAETYCVAWHRLNADGVVYDDVHGVRYLDHFECREGGWRILHRLVVNDWSRLDEVQRISSPNPRRGQRGLDDLSHRAFDFSQSILSLVSG